MLRLFSLIVLILSLAILSCTITSTKTKDPVLKDRANLERELEGIVTAEGYNLSGKELKVNDSTTSQLEIGITNAVGVPENDQQRKELGKLIAVAVKSALVDSNEYDNYTVLFISKKSDGAVVKRTWVGDQFSASEL